MSVAELFYIGPRAYLRINCSRCGGQYEQQRRIHLKAKWKDRCPRCRKQEFFCPDCGKKIYPGSEKCKSCAQRLPLPSCEDCGKRLSQRRCKVCRDCHNKRQDRGISRQRTKFNASRKWARARTACFERDDFTCQSCGARGGYLNAHHIKSYRNYPEHRLEVSNLLTLCKPCHDRIHGLTKKRAA